ncbi:MAG: MarR family winged helix-turn-helix transcriptional regulator [Hyphomicrobiales bacterium]
MSDAAETLDIADSTPEFGKARLRLWIRLLRASRYIEGEVRNRLRQEFDITLPQFDVLAALFRKPDGMLMSELSHHLMVSNGNVTGIVDRLVGDGLVVRAPRDGDRRAWLVKLTPNGRNAFDGMANTHEGWVSEILADVTPQQADELARLLKNLKTKWETPK